MKITPANADPNSIPRPLTTVQVRVTKQGLVVQTRPRRRKIPWSEAQQKQRKRFGFAARMASNPTDIELQTAHEMAKGTQQVPRDILTMAAMGRYYELVNPDGTYWRHTTAATVADEPKPEPPPTPTPTKTRFSDMNWSLWDDAHETPNSTSNYAFKGGRFIPKIDVTVTGMATILYAHAGASYRAAIGTIDGTDTITDLAISDIVTAEKNGAQTLHWPIAYQLTAEARSFAIVGRTDLSGTFSLQIYFSKPAHWLWPCESLGAAFLAQTTPAVGHQFASTTAMQVPPLGLDF